MKNNYSEKEVAMFEALGFGKELEFKVRITPLQLYQFAIHKVFASEITGSPVNSLRRCVIAMDNGKPRLTPEFDALINLDRSCPAIEKGK